MGKGLRLRGWEAWSGLQAQRVDKGASVILGPRVLGVWHGGHSRTRGSPTMV